jgi:hypothetical protein
MKMEKKALKNRSIRNNQRIRPAVIFLAGCLPLLSLLLLAATVATADEIAWSDHYPQIQRLQGVILFPADIETVEAVDPDYGGQPRIQYRFRMYRVRDIGQEIHQDRAKWAAENRKLLYELTYGDLETVVDAIESGTVDALKIKADDVIKRIEMEAVKE